MEDYHREILKTKLYISIKVMNFWVRNNPFNTKSNPFFTGVNTSIEMLSVPPHGMSVRSC